MTNEQQSSNSQLMKSFKNTLTGTSCYKFLVGKNYSIVIKPWTTAKVRIHDLSHKGAKPLVRLDQAHRNTPFNHANLNPKLSGLKTDPHIPLPPGALEAGTMTAKTAKVISDYGGYMLIILELFYLAKAMYTDYQQGTIKNTDEAVSSSAGAYLGGCVGSKLGASLGTSILPGVGTITLGIVGGLAGAFYGASKLSGAYLITNTSARIYHDREQEARQQAERQAQ